MKPGAAGAVLWYAKGDVGGRSRGEAAAVKADVRVRGVSRMVADVKAEAAGPLPPVPMMDED
jgi:hypothetical protein